MKGPVRKAYEIVRPYDNGCYDVWDEAATLQEAEKICAELDGSFSGWAERPFNHRIYEVKRRLVSKAERAKALKRKPKGKQVAK